METTIFAVGGNATELRLKVNNAPDLPLGIKDFKFMQNKKPVCPYMLNLNNKNLLIFTFEKSEYPTFVELVRPGHECEDLINPNEP